MLSRKFIMPVALLSLLMIMSPLSCGEADKTVVFPDPNIDGYIRLVVGKPDGDIYQSDLKSVTSIGHVILSPRIDLYWLDLTGLEYCTNLTSLYLSGTAHCSITDVTPLSNLASLTALYFGGIHLSDVTPLSNVTSLTTLYLAAGCLTNLTTDLSLLTNLTKLTDLYIEGYQINDLGPLSKLTNLGNLSLRYCELSDISPLSSLTGLTHLALEGNHIDDLTPLSNLTSLEHLDLEFNQIRDISPLVENSGLSSGDILNVANNPLSTTSVDVYIPQLQKRGVMVRWSPLSTPTPTLK